MTTALFIKRLFTYIIYSQYVISSCKKNTDTIIPVTNNLVVPYAIGLKHTLPALLNESSGLCYTEGDLWSFGDSGNPNSIYKIDTTSGAILQTVTIANYPNIDWEAITADSLYIYVGDTGNNNGNRKDLKVLRIKKTDMASHSSPLSVNAEAINYSYSDQVDFSSNSNTNFDCEAIVAFRNNLYAFTKNRGDLETRCYRLPKNPGTYTVSPISSFNTNGKITDAAYDPITKELALLGYMNQKLDSFIWFFNGFPDDNFFSGISSRLMFGNRSADWQTEGLDYLSTGRLMMTCETSASHVASLYFFQK